MNRALRHRGPDDEGLHVDPERGVAIGARRLSIIDVENGHQPLCNEDGSVWAVFNGEIYNHPALLKQLEARGHKLRSHTDTEVLVHLYEEYGEALPHALEGMFAFALWDARRGNLVLCRDRFGEKPLFYAQDDGGLTFASELRALTEGTDRRHDIDPAAVDAFFVYGYVPGPHTILKGVKQLPPGHLLRWNSGDGRCEVTRYWSPSRCTARFGQPVSELVAETGQLLERSVRSRLISDVPVGVFLSGGVDSALIAALAARNSTAGIKTFTVGYDVGTVNEINTARELAAAIGSEHDELTLSESDVAARAPGLFASMDQPLADQALLPTNALAEFARKDVKVVVSGEGADEVFGGYPRYRWLARGDRVAPLVPGRLTGVGAWAASRAPISERARHFQDMLGPGTIFERNLDWVTARRRHMRSRLYAERLQPSMSESALIRERSHWPDVVANGSPEAELMRHDQLQWLPDDVLAKADRAGMLVSLEIRTPYLHRELTEFAAAVGPAAHMEGEGKALLRALLAQLLPDMGRRRPKTAWRVPSAAWLRGPLAPLLEEQISHSPLFSEEWLKRDEVLRLASEHRSGLHDHSAVLWPVMTLGVWLGAFRSRMA